MAIVSATALAALAAIAGTAAVGGGIAMGVNALANPTKKPEAPSISSVASPALSPAPTTEMAKLTAAEEVAKQKRMRNLSGGKTILTDSAPMLSSGGGKSLLGS